MKIKPSRLREIIQEEVSQFNSKMSAPPDDITGEPDEEGAMARSQLLKLAKYSAALMDMMNDDTQLPAWVQAKITKSASYLGAVKHFIEGELELNEAVDGDPQFEKIPIERHRIQKVVNAFRDVEDDLDFGVASELRDGIEDLEQILMDDQEAKLGLDEDKQQMKISKQKLERIIKEEVLKEMGMQMREDEDEEQGPTNDFDTNTEKAIRAALHKAFAGPDIASYLAKQVVFENLRTVGKYIVHLPFDVDFLEEDKREKMRKAAYDAAKTVNQKTEIEVEIASGDETEEFKKDSRESW